MFTPGAYLPMQADPPQTIPAFLGFQSIFSFSIFIVKKIFPQLVKQRLQFLKKFKHNKLLCYKKYNEGGEDLYHLLG
jgi:hypothetical protein